MYRKHSQKYYKKEKNLSSPLVSIIIPCYNSEQFLQDALKSVENQSYKNIEVICINDGSEDRTKYILQSYQKKSKRKVIVLNINNSGVSTARNKGIQQSHGEFIFFLDSDDILSFNCIELLIFVFLTIDSEYDISYGLWTKNRNRLSKNTIKLFKSETPYEAMQYYMYRNRNLVFTCYLYRSKIIKEKNIQFDKNLMYGEDNLFLWKYMCHIRKAAYIDMNIYFYRSNKSSVTNNISWKLTDSIKSVQLAYIYMRNVHYTYTTGFMQYIYPRMLLSAAANFALHEKKALYKKLLITYPVKKYSIWLIGKNGIILSAAAFIMFINPDIFYEILRYFSLADKMKTKNIIYGSKRKFIWT